MWQLQFKQNEWQNKEGEDIRHIQWSPLKWEKHNLPGMKEEEMDSTLTGAAGVGGQVMASLCNMWLLEVIVNSLQISQWQFSLVCKDNLKNTDIHFSLIWELFIKQAD